MCDLIPVCVLYPLAESDFPIIQWDGEALGKKAAARPGTMEIWFDRTFWNSLDDAERLIFYLHEVAHCEGAECESCADRRAGEIMAGMGFDMEQGTEAARAMQQFIQFRDNEKACHDVAGGFMGVADVQVLDGCPVAGSPSGLCVMPKSISDPIGSDRKALASGLTDAFARMLGPDPMGPVESWDSRFRAVIPGADDQGPLIDALSDVFQLAPYAPLIVQHAAEHVGRTGLTLSDFAWLIAAVGQSESGWRNSKVVSPSGDYGLMQINGSSHPDYLAEMDDDGNPSVFDPDRNIEMGTTILADALAAFPGDVRAGVSAYNAGAGNVRHRMTLGLSPDDATQDHVGTAGYAHAVAGHLAGWGMGSILPMVGPSAIRPIGVQHTGINGVAIFFFVVILLIVALRKGKKS